eukprot:gene3912-5615_t
MGRRRLRSLDVNGRTAVDIVRMLLVFCMASETSFCRSFGSFSRLEASIIVEFDASLEGIGVIYYSREILDDGEISERLLGGFAASLDSLEFGVDSGYQNTSEFIGLLVGLWGMSRLGLMHSVVELRGDSISALQWAGTSRFGSVRVHK